MIEEPRKADVVEIGYILGKNIKVTKETLFSNTGSFGESGSFEQSICIAYDKLKNIEDPVLFDVGANTGSYSLIPIVLPNLTVYSFEPICETCLDLYRNIILNEVQDNVHIFNYALGEKNDDFAPIVYDPLQNGLSHIINQKELGSRMVKMRTIDWIVETYEIPKIDVLKIDTDGYDWHILKGAEQSIKRFKPIIMVEAYTDGYAAIWGLSTDDYDNLLESYGYKFGGLIDMGRYYSFKNADDNTES